MRSILSHSAPQQLPQPVGNREEDPPKKSGSNGSSVGAKSAPLALEIGGAASRRPVRALLVEDSVEDADLVVRELRRGGLEPVWERVEDEAGMRSALVQGSWDVVIADYSLPQFSGPAALALVQECGPDLPFIVVSGTVGEDIAVAMMKAGAEDYFTKGNLRRLGPAIEREVRDAEIRRRSRRAEAAVRESSFQARTTLDALSAHIAILDASGEILSVNKAWRRFAEKNAPGVPGLAEGANYIDVCAAAAAAGDVAAGDFLARVASRARRREAGVHLRIRVPLAGGGALVRRTRDALPVGGCATPGDCAREHNRAQARRGEDGGIARRREEQSWHARSE